MNNKKFTNRLLYVLLLGTTLLLGSCKKNNHHPVPVNTTPVHINSFTPETAAKDSTVVIHGSGFGTTPGNVGVTFNGVAATVLVVSDDTILKVKVPIHAGNGKINVKVGSQQFTSATNFTYLYTVSTLAGSTYGFNDATGIDAQFDYPQGVAVDAAGNVYVADTYNHRIRKITPDSVVSTLAGNGTPGYVNTTTAGSPAEFAYPFGVAVDATTGNIYVADYYNNCIRKINPTGNVSVSTFAGAGSLVAGGFTNATGTDARFNSPRGVAADAAGNIYVADADNNSIRKITTGGDVTTLAGAPNGSEFAGPYGVAVDAAGNIYVADYYNHRIQKITPEGGVSTLAGDGTAHFKDDPTGTSAEFNQPGGIAVDATGNIYVADTYNNRIRKITPAGVVTTLAGDDNATFKNGVGTSAEFNNPQGIAVDAAGNIYVGDTHNNRIRKLQ